MGTFLFLFVERADISPHINFQTVFVLFLPLALIYKE